ncbi:hypothetical protein PPYR_06235 [Photinus pyralis]|uniref:C2H2-type domain-containing protein n=1 Tax=Photinus pyralis TaxID=7054 RepID=A0A1Y1L4M2_PHOPY|nr:zinc finger protein 501-like [Photinus pyralis]KAB0800495.1 hypothetical protein PPYR_06235 [Photinus pyralis]
MNYREFPDFKEFCKGLPLLVLPSTLWNIHIDPQYHYAIIVQIEMRPLLKLSIERGVLLTMNVTQKTIEPTFFIENEVIDIPKLNNAITGISDLSHVVYAIHNMKVCPNAGQQNLKCKRYLDIDSYTHYCTSCNEDGLTPSFTLYSENAIAEQNISEILPTIQGFKKEQSYGCDKCTDIFTTESQLNEHLESHTPKIFVCKVCNKTSTKESLHLKHINEKQSLCNVCGKVFCQVSRMKEHLLTHSLERPFECSTCHKSFAKSYSLKLHQKTHSGVYSYICSACGKTYTTQSNLKTHIKSTHTKEKPHACTSCDMTFVHPRHLRIHMRKHTGEKPYTCAVCKKSFAKNIHLTVHLRTHTGEKPYECSDCGKGFTTTGNLNSHRRINHKNLDVMYE